MRITNNMLINNMMYHMGNNLTRMDAYQQQFSTGKKISVPSDDPVVAARALKLRTDVSKIDQYQKNVKDALSWMEITEMHLSNMGEILHRTKELSVQGDSGTLSANDIEKITQEVSQLRTQLIQIGNQTYAGRYVFSGYKTDSKLINDDGTFSISVSNSEEIRYEIGVGDNININVLGGDLFNFEADALSGDKCKLIQDFDNLIAALNSGDYTAITNAAKEVDKNSDNLLRIRADLGARMNRLDLTSNRLENDNISFTKLMSENEDVDMAEVIINLKNEENVYRASLSAGARIIQPTLVDFLR